MDPKEIRKILDELDGKSLDDPRKAERRLGDAVCPLLEHQGWGTVWTTRSQDYAVDILGTKILGNGAKARTLGVELKLSRQHTLPIDVVYRMVGVASQARLDDCLLISNRPLSKLASQALAQAAAVNLTFADLSTLRAWLERVEKQLEPAPFRAAEAVKTLARTLARIVADDPHEFRVIEWRLVEHMVAEVLDKLGFNVVLTRAAQDGGKDVIIDCVDRATGGTYIIEIKHWACGKPVTGDKLAYFLNVVMNERHESGLFLSTSGYAGNAFEAVAKLEHQKLQLGSEDKIITLCTQYVKSQDGLWNTPAVLKEILFEGTVPAGSLKMNNPRTRRKPT